MKAIYKLQDLPKVAMQLYQHFGNKKVWAFYAPMGAGKTTLIHELCSFLNVEDEVSSPTFAIINQYKSPKENTIYHMDWYRLKDEEEAIQAGVEDVLFSGSLCLIEWPSIVESLLPNDVVNIEIEIIDNDTRMLIAKTNS
jgi:tRNA threonylcarbamoyladenosine biosynthesis protein TsaE